MRVSRRGFVTGTVAAGMLRTSRARSQTPQPLRIGVLTDLTGFSRNNGGPTAVACTRQAVQDFDPEAHGLKVEILMADHQNRPDIGLSIARQWYDQGVDVIVDVNNSAVALGLISLAEDKDKLQVNTGAGTGELTGPRCSYNTLHWNYNTYVFANSTGSQVVRTSGRTWFFITADYAFGHASQQDCAAVVGRLGGKVVGNVLYPGAGATSDFSSILLQAQASGVKSRRIVAHPGWQDRRAIMRCHVLIRAADPRLVTAGRGDPSLEVIADDLPGHPGEAGKCANMAADPVRERLRPAGLSVSEVGGAQHRDKHLRPPELAGGIIHHLRRLPGIVDEHPLAGRVRLAHGWRQAAAPIAREVAKTTVTIPIRLLGPILLPKQEEGHARLAKLGVDTGPLRLRPRRLGRERRREQLALQRRVVERLRHRPRDPDHGSPTQILGHRIAADADHDRDLWPLWPQTCLRRRTSRT
jgi:hypothetical protein